MKILYDHQAFALQRRGGVSRYFVELLRKIPSETDARAVLSLLYSNNEYLYEESSSPRQKNTIHARKNIKEFLKKKLHRNKLVMKAHLSFSEHLNKIRSKRYLRKQDFDIFHPTYYDPYFLPYLKGKPFVLTIHDMIHELFPEYFSTNDTTIARKRLLATHAEKIIAVSQNTKDDIVKFLKINPKKITVVHHANFLTIKDEEPMQVPERYILYVGGRGRYKNFAFFVESIASILDTQNNLYILCIGGGTFKDGEKDFFHKLSIEKKILQLTANDKQLVYLYRHAECLALPSLYEGFGIPILEAFAHGCPVLLSNTSCFPEIAVDAGSYFNPQNKTSIILATQKMLGDSAFRQELIQKGYDRVNHFSSSKMVQETYAVYEQCIRI